MTVPSSSFPAARPADTTEAAVALREYLTRPDVPCQYVEIFDALAAAARRTEQAETEAAEWKREAELGRWPKEAAQEYHAMKVDLPAALARVRDLEQALEDADEHLRLACDLALPRVLRSNLLNARRRLRAALVSGAAEGNSDE